MVNYSRVCSQGYQLWI